MYVDGFRFDLASVFSRNSDGSINLTDPMLFADIMSDPVFAGLRFIAEPWDAAGVYQLGRGFPELSWLQCNGEEGYGLTETSSVVTTNHPLHPTRGSLGKAVGNQQIRLAPDGEILVRGDNVSFELFGREESGDEWLHTGDLGENGPDGTLYYKR